LMVLAVVTPAAANWDPDGPTAAQDVAADCEQATMGARPGGPEIKITTDVSDRATVAPGQDIGVRLTWDPEAWSAPELDMALGCVHVKGTLNPDMSDGEQPTANDGEGVEIGVNKDDDRERGFVVSDNGVTVLGKGQEVMK
ncbi:MAG TPA: hypothetical protein VNQ53_18795, partial [Nocardioides sp.]|nr:hypothetical protein [Nocardioides sp.]